MTVKELINELSQHDPDLLVVGRGYEDGYDDVGVRLVRIVDVQGPDEKRSWWSGRYDDADYRFGHDPFNALVID